MDEQRQIIVDLYNSAVRYHRCCPEQKRIFQHWADHNSDPCTESMAWDTETTGLTLGIPSPLKWGSTDIMVNNPFPFGLSLAIPYEDRIALFWGRLGTEMFDEIIKLLGVGGCKVAHNAKYDMRTCKTNGIYVAPTIHCTLTMARIYWDRLQEFALQRLCEHLCPEISDWEVGLKKLFTKIKSSYTRKGYPKGYANYSFIPDEIIRVYSMTDVFVTLMLNARLMATVQKEYLEVYSRERQVFHVVSEIETRGLCFDMRQAQVEITQLEEKKAEITATLQRITGDPEFKPTKPKLLAEQLIKFGVTRKQLSPKGSVTTEKKVLESIRSEVKGRAVKLIDQVLTYRSMAKLVSTYLNPLRTRALYNNGIVYFTLNPTDTRTGRMSSSNPNLQNIPRPDTGELDHNPVRACFLVRPGYFNYFFDYSQMEMAMFGLLSNDRRIVEAYAQGFDLHGYMATLLFGVDPEDKEAFKPARQRTKSVNFGVIYGMGIKHLAEVLDITIPKATEFMEMYNGEFPTIHALQKKCQQDLWDKGYVEDMFGRRYHMDPGQAYKAVNSLIQGGCAQCMKIAFNRVQAYCKMERRKGRSIYMLVPIHDEFMIERRKRYLNTEVQFVTRIKDLMEDIPQLRAMGFRYRVDCKRSTTNWEEKVGYEIPETKAT